ncbi:MAG: hypothetical protein ACE5F6_17140 [Anaerolineae bacterium]
MNKFTGLLLAMLVAILGTPSLPVSDGEKNSSEGGKMVSRQSSMAPGSAASSATTWAALYGGSGSEEMEGVWATADGGYVVSGSTDSYGDPNGEAWILKLDQFGNIEWQKTYGGTGDEYIIDIKQTGDGGYIGAGWTTSFGAGQMDFWVLKLDANGNIEWEKTYGGTRREQGWSVEPTTDGGYIVAGGTLSFGAGGADYWVLKLGANGDIEWQRAYGGNGDDGGGGDYEEFVVRVLQDADGNYVVASETSSFGAGETDIWVIKLDADGNILWEKAYGGSDEDTMWTFVEASDGGYIIPGVTVSFSPDYSGDVWVLKLDKDGKILWQKVYAIPDNWYEALSVGSTSDGGALVGSYREEGETDWDLILLRLDTNGNALWQKVFEYGWDWPNAVQELPDGGYVVAGVAWPNPSPEDLWVLRLAQDGTIDSSCSFPSDIPLTQDDTDSIITNTNATVTETNVIPQNSSATVQNSSTSPNYLCQAAPSPDCPGDLTGDNKVNLDDIMVAANGWGKHPGETGYDARVDRSGDGEITVDEVQWIAVRWGPCQQQGVAQEPHPQPDGG